MALWLPALLLAVSCSARLTSVRAETLYVAPNGNDHWTGRQARPNAARTDGPLASLAGARDAVRGLHGHGPVRVMIAEGAYPLTEPVVFTPDDSGTPAAPVTYEAAPGAHPVFEAGRRITGFQRRADGLWAAPIPTDRRFEQMWVNDRRAVRARTPNQFYLYTQGKVTYGVDPLTGQPTNLANRAFIARPEDIKPLLALSPAELADVTLVAYHSWEASRHHIASIDAKTNTVILANPAPWPLMEWTPTQRYVLENYRAALDAPGEWFLGRDGVLLYQPLPGEDPKTAQVIAPVAEQFVRLEGTADHKISDIAFQGLTFAYAGYTLPPQGQGDGQAAVSIPAVFQADFAQRVTLDHCEIAHTGLYGVWFRQGCTDCAVRHTCLHDLGAGGVRLGETEIRPAGPQRTDHNTVDNTIIRGDGRIFPGAIGIWIGQSGDNQITHNDISDTYYTAISVGWTWGYGPSLATNNHIDFNRIHHIGQGVLSDMGGVYTLGISTGTTINNNVIFDVRAYNRSGRGGWGLYNDEGSSNITLENNLVYDTHTGSYHQHYGEKNLIQNNIFAYSLDGQLQHSRVEDRLAFTFRRNAVIWDQGPLFTGAPNGWQKNVVLDHNLYWNTAKQPFTFAGQSLAERQASGLDIGSLVADPGFVNAKKGDFALKPGSPLAKIGFVPFDYSKAGVYGDAAWVKLARSFVDTPAVLAPDPPPPPPLTIHQDFENIPVGQPDPDGQTYMEHKGDSILVTDETAASGHHSLKFTDAPGLQVAYDPYLVFSPNYTRGVTTMDFALRIEDGVNFYHEWRDWRTEPYKVGPSFTIVGGKLSISGNAVMNIPSGVWGHYEVQAAIGKGAAGKWTLTVTLPGKPPQVFRNLPNGSADFSALTWIGFVSNANDKTVFYLDDVNLTNAAP